MNNLEISDNEIKNYLGVLEKKLNNEIEVKEAIEKRGELYPGESNYNLENIKNYKKIIKLLMENLNIKNM